MGDNSEKQYPYPEESPKTFLEQAYAVKHVWKPFIAAVGVLTLAIWGITHWEYSKLFAEKDATIQRLEAYIANPIEDRKPLPTFDPHIKGKQWNNGGVTSESEG